MNGTVVGTYNYMAPEVFGGRPYGSTADIYSLGLVLYWLLNERRLPFLPLPPAAISAEEDEQARIRRLRGERLHAPQNGSAALKRIVLKACEFSFYSADNVIYFAIVYDSSDSPLVKIHYWGDQIVGYRDYRSDKELRYTDGYNYDAICAEFDIVFDIGMGTSD